MRTSEIIDLIKKYDFSFFGVVIAIFIMGIVNLYSATHASSSVAMANIYKVQMTRFAFALAVGAGISFIHPRNFFRFHGLFMRQISFS